MLASMNLDDEVFAIPRIVDAKGVGSRAYVESCRIAEHQFALIFAIERNFDLPGLRVVGRIADDGDLSGGRVGMFRLRHGADNQE